MAKQPELIKPGEILREEFMEPFGCQYQPFGSRDCRPAGKDQQIVNGKRSITADTALRLGKYFGVSAEIWIGLQADYDLRRERRRAWSQIDKQVRPHATV